jgi:phosphonate transport system substrate-binding protein
LIKKLFILASIYLSISCFVGCVDQDNIKKVDLTKVEEAKANHESMIIKIGLVPEQDIRKMAARYEPLAEYLAKKLGLQVTLIYLDSYGEVCDKFLYKQLDAAFFGSFSYALTHAKAGVESIVRPDYHGTSTYRGLIVVREDSNIRNVADMKDKRIALVHRATYAGYLYPLYYFKKHGIGDLETYFSKVMYMGSHDKTIFAVLRGEADVATPKDLIYQRVIEENPDLKRKLVVLSASGPVPSNALCVSKDLDPTLKNKLKEALLNLGDSEEIGSVTESLGATRFIETRDEDYAHLYKILLALDIDLNTYPYYDRPDMGFIREDYEQDTIK